MSGGRRRGGHVGPRQVVADDVVGGDVGQHRDAQAAPPVLVHGDDRGGGGPALGHHVQDELDRWADDHRTREHRVRRTHRLVRESFGHGHNRLGEHLGAFHHLTFVADRDAGVPGEPVVPVGPHVKQIQQALHRPLGLLRFRGQVRSTSRVGSFRPSVTL